MNGFSAIADPHRRAFLDALRIEDRDVGSLVEQFQLPQSLVSKHLRVLRDAGLVESRIAGKRRVYRLVERPMPEVVAWVESYARFWNERFDRLAAELTELEKRRDDHVASRPEDSERNRARY